MLNCQYDFPWAQTDDMIWPFPRNSKKEGIVLLMYNLLCSYHELQDKVLQVVLAAGQSGRNGSSALSYLSPTAFEMHPVHDLALS